MVTEYADYKLTVTIFANEPEDLEALLYIVAVGVANGEVTGNGGGYIGSYVFDVQENTGGTEMTKVTLFNFGEVAQVDLPLGLDELVGKRTLLTINGLPFVKTAQAYTLDGECILLVRPVVEIPGLLEGEAAVKAECLDAAQHGAGWLDKSDAPLDVVWERAE